MNYVLFMGDDKHGHWFMYVCYIFIFLRYIDPSGKESALRNIFILKLVAGIKKFQKSTEYSGSCL
jgi:hypothetical protein